MTTATRLPAEIIPFSKYNPNTLKEYSSSTILDAGRMPTARGRMGVIADRTVTTGIMRDPKRLPLFQVYMLAALRPQDGEVSTELDERYELSATHEFWSLQVSDVDFWRFNSEVHAFEKQRYGSRYYIELWNASPDIEWHNSGHPEHDRHWDAFNSCMGWGVPDKFGLVGARAAAERFAHLLVQGKTGPLDGQRTAAQVNRAEADMRAQWTPYLTTLNQHNPGAARRINDRVVGKYRRWVFRPEELAYRRLSRELHHVASQAHRAAHKKGQRQAHAGHLRRALGAVELRARVQAHRHLSADEKRARTTPLEMVAARRGITL